MALAAEEIILNGATITVSNGRLLIDGKDLWENSFAEEMKFLKEIVAFIKKDNPEYYNKLCETFSVCYQINSILDAFDGDKSHLFNILEKRRELKNG